MDKDPVPYDRENKEHEKLLQELWSTVFPDIPLDSRVSEQWKVMGFQVKLQFNNLYGTRFQETSQKFPYGNM